MTQRPAGPRAAAPRPRTGHARTPYSRTRNPHSRRAPYFRGAGTGLAVLLAMTLLAGSAAAQAQQRQQQQGARAQHYADVVVYCGTAGGVIAAVAAAREGASVILLEPGRHLGGMVSGGLGATDAGRTDTIGGYAREFFARLGKHYGKDGAVWRHEPSVAAAAFNAMAKEAGVAVLFEHRLLE